MCSFVLSVALRDVCNIYSQFRKKIHQTWKPYGKIGTAEKSHNFEKKIHQTWKPYGKIGPAEKS